MNWKLIFSLSLFGLVMAFATISLVPEKAEPAFWLIIFVICAWLIVKNAPGKYFLHGFLVSLVNSVWITGAHVYFFTDYITHHPNAASMSAGQAHPRMMMLFMGPVFGVVFGLILGLFAFVTGKIIKKAQ